MNPNAMRILLFITLLHIAVVLFFFSAPIFCSEPGRNSFLNFAETTIKQMEKLKVSPSYVCDIIKKSSPHSLGVPNASLYICSICGTGVAVDEAKRQIVSVMDEASAYALLGRADAIQAKRRMRYQI